MGGPVSEIMLSPELDGKPPIARFLFMLLTQDDRIGSLPVPVRLSDVICDSVVGVLVSSKSRLPLHVPYGTSLHL